MIDSRSDVRSGQDGGQEPAASPRPPKGPRVRYLLVLLVIAVGMLWVGTRFGPRIADELRLMAGTMFGSGEDGAEDEGKTFYTCGMHPWVILPKPGLCPICHMDLTPIDPSKFTGEIRIDPVVVQNIGVRIAPVVTGPLVRTVRTVGKVEWDETRIKDVNLRVSGWIEKLHVDYLGAEVTRGAPLLELYSRELYAAQEEYLLALAGRRAPGVPFLENAQEDRERLLAAARTRLELFGVTADRIAELEERGRPSRTMTIESGLDGVVIEKHAFEGMRVEPGMRVFRIADPSRVWVQVTVYESQLPFVQLGQDADMTLPYVAGQHFAGKVTYINPWVDEKTREVQVRLEFDNPGGVLKQGMFANVELRRRLEGDRVLAPRSAIIDTGERKVAFVSLGSGRFDPRDVRTGVEAGDGTVEVLAGLEAGEMVVTSGQFLLDSESRIREGLLRLIRGTQASEQESVDLEVAKSELEHLDEAMARDLDALLTAYLAIGEALAGDGTQGVVAAAEEVATRAQSLASRTPENRPHFWHEHPEVGVVRDKARDLSQKADLEQVRLIYADLSKAAAALFRATGVPPGRETTIEEYHCPMYLGEFGGADWLQAEGSKRNPYFGKSMLRCGDRTGAMPVTGKAPGGAGGAGDVDALVHAYLAASAALAADSVEGLDARWKAIGAAAEALARQGGGVEAPARQVLAALPALSVDGVPGDLGKTREAFEGLSAAVIALVHARPPSAAVGPALRRGYCPMVKASWLQLEPEVVNPYMGSDMLRCGTIEETIELAPVGHDGGGGHGGKEKGR
ncbi:MAG: efflux RND transporter periplasmic adaptor subunit [Planctomycetota bacterium]